MRKQFILSRWYTSLVTNCLRLQNSNSFKSKPSNKIWLWKAGRNSTLKHMPLIQKLIFHYHSSLALDSGMDLTFQGGAHSPLTLFLRAVSQGSSNAEANIPYSAECSKQGNSLTSGDASKDCVWNSNYSFAHPFAGLCSKFKYSTFGPSVLDAFHSMFLVVWDCQVFIWLDVCTWILSELMGSPGWPQPCAPLSELTQRMTTRAFVRAPFKHCCTIFSQHSLCRFGII